jgi:hypothetical protein
MLLRATRVLGRRLQLEAPWAARCTAFTSKPSIIVDAVSSRVVVEAGPGAGAGSLVGSSPFAAPAALARARGLYLAISDGADGDRQLQLLLSEYPDFSLASIDVGLRLLKAGDTVGAHKHLTDAHGGLSRFRDTYGSEVPAEDIQTKAYAMHVGLAQVYRSRGDTHLQRTHLEHR